ncbi:ATP-dependent DNA helicase RecG [hydrothermal vent metagenome]|uniref:ATP-dependent DNA helicase RecG n=1 Tax=hydrothermal vent metagenome TaxID=652676 RepID=A0A1W1EI48_9ZZZZ
MNDDKALLTKAKIYSLLDLALNIPISYSDTTLSSNIEYGKKNILQAVVKSINSYNNKLYIEFYLPKFDRYIKGIFFRVTFYHFKIFVIGSEHYIEGKVELYGEKLQINQPKSLQNINRINPKYKTNLKQNEIIYLIERYISKQSLLNEGLNEIEVDTILKLHNPNTIDEIYNEKEYRDDILKVLKFVEAFNHIKKLSKKKRDYPPMKTLNGDIREFINNLEFKLTPEQIKVINDIERDLKSPKKATKRMVVGDVGSGKTMVILASIMMSYPNKSILMAPTSILAQQLYDEAQKHLPNHIKSVLIMQGAKKSGDLEEFDVIIGTHALLFREDLPSAPLVMVDEQHRFGSKQRQRLENMMGNSDKKAHYIQFSATPIPRTQAMMNSAMIDVSLITSTPFKKDIESIIISKNDFRELLSHIEDEISQNHQVVIIYPLVEASESIEYQSLEESIEFWQNRFENFYYTHGKDKNKEKTLIEFREKGDILLATTVVEVGISLPRLTTIVIVGAERLGLASLHQLRGRVGRNGLKSRCYLYTNNLPNSRLEQFAKTTSGFDIALLDLKYRKSGDLLDGSIQSGVKNRWLDMATDYDIIKEASRRI